MAQPFSSEQLSEIKRRLIESAKRHALSTGMKKTSLDALTADAGIAKSTFYKFYDCKEQLFLEIAGRWEADIIASALNALRECAGQSSKRRAAAFVCAAFERVHELGVTRFMREDFPLLGALVSRDKAKEHMLHSAENILLTLKEEGIAFAEPDETVVSVVQLLYLSILNIGDFGDNYFPALKVLVESACDRLVA